MIVADLGTQPELIREQAAALLVEGFDEPRGWPTHALARAEVTSVLREGFARRREWPWAPRHLHVEASRSLAQ